MTRLLRSALSLGFAWAVVVPVTAADLVTLAGTKTSGTLIQVDKDFVTLQPASGQPIKIPVKDIAAVELQTKPIALPADTKFDELELTDGSILKVRASRFKGRIVDLDFLVGPAGVPPPTIELPLGSVNWLMRSAEDPKFRDDWKKLLGTRGKRDLFVIRQAEGLNPLAGTVLEGSETGDRITFEREDGTRTPLPLTRATGGLVLNQASKDIVAPLLCKVVDRFGNTLLATQLTVEGSAFVVKTVSGAMVRYATAEALVKLDFGQGNITYLSDLDAVATYPPVEKDGVLGEQFPLAILYQKDRPIGGGELLLGGTKFTRGISVPPDVSLTYKLEGQHREFKTVIGILDGIKPDDGALRVRVEVDGREVFNEIIKKKAKPRDLNLNVKDARELKLIVEQLDLFSGNQVNFVDARLQK